LADTGSLAHSFKFIHNKAQSILWFYMYVRVRVQCVTQIWSTLEYMLYDFFLDMIIAHNF